MTKFTNQENATRKQVFAYIRNNDYATDTILRNKFGRSKVVMAAITEARRRIANGQPESSEHKIFFRSLLDKADAFAKCLPSSGYSMGEHKRITNRLYGILGNSFNYDKKVIGSYDNTQEYRGSKYKATHGEVRAELPVSILAKAEVLDSMITIRKKQVQKNIWKCEWLVWDYDRNKRGFITTAITWHMEKGYVAKLDATLHYGSSWYHCTTLAEAREKLTARAARLKAEIKARDLMAEWLRAHKEFNDEKGALSRSVYSDKQERAAVMVHRKNYTQQEVNRAAWKIFGKIASRQDSCLYNSIRIYKRGYHETYGLNINKDDTFERDVETAYYEICKEHDVLKELSKHNSRQRQAEYWSEQPVNILHHEMVVNFDKALDVNESKMHMPLPYDSLYAYRDRDKRILKILTKMFRRKQTEKQEAVVKSAELADGLKHMYVYRDSIAAGNCVPGTDGFLADHNLKKTDTRSGEFLLRISRGTWQHANVTRIVERYINTTYPKFYEQNQRAISSILSTL